MSRTIKTWLLLLTLSLTIFSCEKEYSEENGGTINGGGTQGGTAVFTLAGAPGGCTTPSVAGTYTAGTVLTASEKVTLIVDVTTIGTYTITSGTANGIKFSGSGTFTATGQQFIELTATGNTPASPGTFTYVPGTAGCSFTITYLASTGSSGGTAVYTLNGAPDDCTTPVISGDYVAGTALTAANTVQLMVNVTTIGTYTISTGTANGIKFTATGSFTATGANTITLVGEGTPVSQSTIQYTPGANGCSFNITTTGGGTPPVTDYLKATISGTATEFNTGVSGISLVMAGFPSSLSIDGSQSSPTASGDFSIAFTDISGAAITTGNYTNISAINFTKGVIVNYVDATNTTYASSLTATSINCTLSTLSPTRATGTFSGTLYKDGSGPETKVITNGTFSVPVQ